MIKKEFKITGMSCQHCVAKVEEGISTIDGVKKVKVNLKKSNGKVKYDEEKLSDETIIAKVKEVGYEAQVV